MYMHAIMVGLGCGEAGEMEMKWLRNPPPIMMMMASQPTNECRSEYLNFISKMMATSKCEVQKLATRLMSGGMGSCWRLVAILCANNSTPV